MANTADEQREREKKAAEAAAQAQGSQKSGCLIGGLVFVVLGVIFGGAAGTGGAFLILGIAVVVGIVVAVSNNNKTNTAVAQTVQHVETLQEKRRREMDIVLSSARQSGFIISKMVVNISNTACLAFDPSHEKFLVKDESSWRLLSYKQLVSYELCKNGSSIVSGDASGAIVGGLLFGTVGAIAGAAGSSKSVNNYCSDMYISIVDDSANRYKIPLVKESILESSLDYKIAIERAREMISILSVIDNSNKNDPEQKQSGQLKQITPAQKNRSNSDQNNRNFEAIKKYKELLDMGIITQAEFNAKKAELLGIGQVSHASSLPMANQPGLSSQTMRQAVTSSSEKKPTSPYDPGHQSTNKKIDTKGLCAYYDTDSKACTLVSSDYYYSDCYHSSKHIQCQYKVIVDNTSNANTESYYDFSDLPEI